MTLKWNPQPEPQESVRINLEGVQSVIIDAEVLAEYRTTIKELEKELRQAKFDVGAQIGYYNIVSKQVKRIKGYWKTEQTKSLGLERWRQSL